MLNSINDSKSKFFIFYYSIYRIFLIILFLDGFQLLPKAVKFNSFSSAPPGSTHGAADGRKRQLEFFVLESMHLSALRSLVNLRSKPEALKTCHCLFLPTTALLSLLNAGLPLVYTTQHY